MASSIRSTSTSNLSSGGTSSPSVAHALPAPAVVASPATAGGGGAASTAIATHIHPVYTYTDLSRCVVNVGKSINAVSSSPEGNRIAVVGREVLKVYALEEEDDGVLALHQLKNLRVGRTNLTFSSVDVQWNPHPERVHLIATAATNKNIIIWNLNRGQKSQQEHVIKEHSRTVNSLCWSPNSGDELLSASQDGTVKLWDLRDVSSACKTFAVPRAQSVREVRYSPYYRNFFASAYDDGSIQIWDIREPKAPLQQLASAHNGLVLALDWHPTDKNVLASGGRDRFFKMWNLKRSQNKPVKSVQTSGAVGRIRWRPKYSNMIACSFSTMDSTVHVWDMEKPNIPAYALDKAKDVATGIEWVQNLPSHALLASKDGSIGVYRVPEDAITPYHHIRTAGLAWDNDDGVACINDVIDRAEYDTCPPRDAERQHKSKSLSLFGFTQSLSQAPPSPMRAAAERGVVYDVDTLARLPELCQIQPDTATFRFFAENYVFNTAGKPQRTVRELCGANEEVAEVAGRPHVAQFWRMLQFLYGEEEVEVVDRPEEQEEGEEAAEDDSKSQRSVGSALRKAESSMGSDYVFDREDGADLLNYREDGGDMPYGFSDAYMDFGRQHLSVLSSEAYMPVAPLPEELAPDFTASNERDLDVPEEKETLDSLALAGPFDQNAPEFSYVEVVSRSLRFHAERGDVQTCVAVSLVLGDLLDVDASLLAIWYQAYVELLRRCELWVEAAAVIQCSAVSAVRQLGQKSTTIHVSCPTCKKPLPDASSSCAKCNRQVANCSICHQIVRGVYVWCQGCGHGGHLRHMREWFDQQSLCPTGCNHVCKLTE